MKNRTKALLLSVSLVLAWCDRAHSQERLPTTKNYILLAQEFLNALYPDLNGKGWTMSLETSQKYDDVADRIATFKLYVGKGPKGFTLGHIGGYTGATPPENYHPGPIYSEQYLTSDFTFDDKGRLISFSASGPAVGKPSDLQKIGELLLNHPKMTELQAEGTLIEAGAKFGSWNKDKFMEHFPRKDLERFLGKLSITSAEFPVPDKDHVLPNGWPMWTVMAEATDTNGIKPIYKLEFEPFKGDLTSLTTVPFPPIAGTEKHSYQSAGPFRSRMEANRDDELGPL